MQPTSRMFQKEFALRARYRQRRTVVDRRHRQRGGTTVASTAAPSTSVAPSHWDGRRPSWRISQAVRTATTGSKVASNPASLAGNRLRPIANSENGNRVENSPSPRNIHHSSGESPAAKIFHGGKANAHKNTAIVNETR